MPLDVFFAREAHSAQRAHEVLGRVVDRSVPSEVPSNAEAFTANVTEVLFLSRVHREVTNELLPKPKPLRAEGTRVRKRISVDFPVDA